MEGTADGLIQLVPGLTWNVGSTPCTFIRISNAGGLLTGLIKRGDDYEEQPLAELAREIVLENWASNPELRERADDDWMIAGLPAEAHAEMRRRLFAVMEVLTGIGRGGVRRPEYDLASTTKAQRIKRKAAEIEVAPRTLWRWVRDHSKDGDAGLVHGNRIIGSPLDLYSTEVVQIALGLVEEEMSRSTKTQQSLVALLNQRLRDQGFKTLSVYKAGTLLDEVSRGRSLRGTAKTRKSKASRPRGGRGHVRPSIANEVWEIDSNRLDVLAYSPLTKAGVPVYVISIQDRCTRILSTYVTLTPPSATSVGLALHRRMSALHLDPALVPTGPAIPAHIFTPEDGPLVHPGGVPGEIHADHGAEYENKMILSLLTSLGIDLIFARPRTGSDKPHVESEFRTLNHTVCQLLAGYKGHSADYRGEHPERESLATLDQIRTILDGYCLAHNNSPHTGLPHPARLGTYMTPMDAYTASILAGAPPRLAADPNLIFRFMPTKSAVMSGRGPTIDGIVYTSDDPEVMRRLSAGDRHVPGRPLAFHYDPGDRSCVHWHEPGTAVSHELVAHGVDGTAIPPLSDEAYDRAMQLPAARRPNKQDRADATLAMADYVRDMLTTTAGARSLRREFNRYQERLARFAATAGPLRTATPGSAGRGKPRPTAGRAVAEPPPVFDLDLDAYVDEIAADEETLL